MAITSKARYALLIYLSGCCAVFGGLGMLLFAGWWTPLPAVMPDFGATAPQCEAMLGHPRHDSFAKPQLDPQTLFYNAGAWYFLVGLDEEGHAEKFIVCKEMVPFWGSPRLSESEQKAVLARFGAGKTWTHSEDGSAGPIWYRADNQVIASYITTSHWMVLMNEKAMNRHLTDLRK